MTLGQAGLLRNVDLGVPVTVDNSASFRVQRCPELLFPSILLIRICLTYVGRIQQSFASSLYKSFFKRGLQLQVPYQIVLGKISCQSYFVSSQALLIKIYIQTLTFFDVTSPHL